MSKTQTYSDNKVERFLEVLLHQYLPPATKAKTLTAIAYSMSLNEIAETRKSIEAFYDERIKRFEDLGAPQVIIDSYKHLKQRRSAYLERAERRFTQ